MLQGSEETGDGGERWWGEPGALPWLLPELAGAQPRLPVSGGTAIVVSMALPLSAPGVLVALSPGQLSLLWAVLLEAACPLGSEDRAVMVSHQLHPVAS